MSDCPISHIAVTVKAPPHALSDSNILTKAEGSSAFDDHTKTLSTVGEARDFSSFRKCSY